jgi:hypothetical protein
MCRAAQTQKELYDDFRKRHAKPQRRHPCPPESAGTKSICTTFLGRAGALTDGACHMGSQRHRWAAASGRQRVAKAIEVSTLNRRVLADLGFVHGLAACAGAAVSHGALRGVGGSDCWLV